MAVGFDFSQRRLKITCSFAQSLQDLIAELSLLHEDLVNSGAQIKLLDLKSFLDHCDSSTQNTGKQAQVLQSI
jgi:hypothetical protein